MPTEFSAVQVRAGLYLVVPQVGDGRQQGLQRQRARAVVHLQRADAGREVQHAIQRAGFECLHQRMAAEAQHQVQLRRADLQQQVGVAGQAGHQALVAVAEVQHDGRSERAALPVHRGGFEGLRLQLARVGQRAGGRHVDGHEGAREHLAAGGAGRGAQGGQAGRGAVGGRAPGQVLLLAGGLVRRPS